MHHAKILLSFRSSRQSSPQEDASTDSPPFVTDALGDVMVFDEMVVHTAHNPTTEPAVLMEAQLRASDRPLAEFIPELATPVG